MRPVRLTLQAFGSYAREITVDFARLSLQGVFAISGPTGSGKSTLFDALVYALYGDLPGFREDGTVRSQYATDAVETRVRLEFEAHGERWAIERAPAQMVRRRRGRGEPVERKSSVVLVRVADDGTEVAASAMSRKTAVAERVDELVGLSKAQFEQVVLIPQGRFEEVLKADTKARAPLLRRLFPVDVYGRVTAGLKSIADERHAALAEATHGFDELVGRLGTSLVEALKASGEPLELGPGRLGVDDLARHLTALSAARTSLERTVAHARIEHDRAQGDLERGRQAAAAWIRWRQDVDRAMGFGPEEEADTAEARRLAQCRRVADLEGTLRSWEQATSDLDRLQRALDAQRERVARACAAVDWPEATVSVADAGMAARSAERVRCQADELQAAAAAFDLLLAGRRALEDRRRALAERRREADSRSEAIARERAALALLGEEASQLLRLSSAREGAQARVEALVAEHERSFRSEAAEREQLAALGGRDEAAATAGRAQRHLDAVRRSWRDGVAGRLAELLADGEPCPTCGAVEHPRPAQETVGASDDDELVRAEQAFERAQGLLQAAESRLAAARATVQALPGSRPASEIEAELEARQVEHARCAQAADRLPPLEDELSRRRQALESEVETLGAYARLLGRDEAIAEADRSALDRECAGYERRHGATASPGRRASGLEELAADLDSLAQLLQELENVTTVERQCRSLLGPVVAELGLQSPDGLGPWRTPLEQVEAHAAALAARADARSGVRHRIAAYESSGAPQAQPDVVRLEELAAAAQDRHLELVGRQAVMNDNAGFFLAGPALLETAAKEVNAARRAFEQARTMADRCAGAGGGATPTRLSLENWVLAEYLRRVLVQANERLATMTGGRFALQLRDEATDGRKACGLELSAFDAHTGQVRPATTLSGGETFMAALALALGLADVVSGGSNREMGALFVDEGFGSLDPQALDSVVDVLRSLEDGGRIVGVVSHVEAIHQALPIGITVRSTPCGSEAEVHYPAD